MNKADKLQLNSVATHWYPTKIVQLLGLSLLGSAGLSGCLSKQAQPGDEVVVTCHGQQWVHCFRQADKRCGSRRYQLVSQLTDAGSNASGNNDSLIHGTFTQRTLVARCTDGQNPSEEQNNTPNG